jgi:hypothetical protein
MTNPNGEYNIWGLMSGEYKVAFMDGLVCTGSQYGLTYVPQYYDDKATEAEATAIEVTAPLTVAAINASVELAKAPEPSITEYLCNEGESQPSQTVSWTLPWAIEPGPVNTKAVEEFYASHPAPTTPIPGVAVPAKFASVRGTRADVSIQCPGSTVCHGWVKLVAAGRRRIIRRDGRVAVKGSSNVVVGTASFWLGAGASETVKVPLTTKGRALLTQRAGKAVDITLAGSGVESVTLVVR